MAADGKRGLAGCSASRLLSTIVIFEMISAGRRWLQCSPLHACVVHRLQLCLSVAGPRVETSPCPSTLPICHTSTVASPAAAPHASFSPAPLYIRPLNPPPFLPTPPLHHLALFPAVIMAAFVPSFLGSPVPIPARAVTTARRSAAAAPPAPCRVAVTPRAAAADDSIVNPESTGFAAGAKEGVTDGKTKMEKEFAAEVPIPPGQGTEVTAEQRAEVAAAARAKADSLKEQAAIAKYVGWVTLGGGLSAQREQLEEVMSLRSSMLPRAALARRVAADISTKLLLG